MSVGYQAVLWNRQKRIYDLSLWAGILLYIGAFVAVGLATQPNMTAETLIIRSTGTAALFLLHVILSIGPLARLDRRFLPLLYNRRHMGVSMFILGLVHGGFALFQFHGFGDINPLVSLFISNTRIDSLSQFPFQPLGFVALAILFVMAATSHDFWLHNLSAPVWKSIHMLVYAAYGLLVLHVTLGVLQAERHPANAIVTAAGLGWILCLHLVAARREENKDRATDQGAGDYVDVCSIDDIPEKRAHIANLAGERVAIFRYDGMISAVSNVCQHQNGPLGEGRVIDGCITCPWHGYQYLPDSGSSPPPFMEKIPTFKVQVTEGRVLVDPKPSYPGTQVEPARVDGPGAATNEEFYIGYQPKAPQQTGRFLAAIIGMLLIAATGMGAMLAASMSRLPDKSFEFGVTRDFVGILEEDPVPTLLIQRPGQAESRNSRFLLVGFGKRGADEAVDGLDGKIVRLTGSLIYRDDRTMIELAETPIEALADDVEAGTGVTEASNLGTHTLVGEIIDSKCWLGVMNPGSTKTHKACAIRCISGGIPPALLVRQDDGSAIYLLLLDEAGETVNTRILDKVAERVQITGMIQRLDDLLVLRADPQTIRRLDR